METDGSLELYTEKEIAPAVETFSTQLDSYLVYVGLPKDHILVSYDRRRPVFQNVPTVLASLTDDQRLAAVYISKFVAACAVGLFDAALNYLWNETVRNLREKVARFDLRYFCDSVVNDGNQRPNIRTEADLEKLDDWELIRGCRITGIITENGFRHLDYVRSMRNHASAAHPNQNEITGLQIVSWLETCILEVLAKEPAGPVIEIRKLLHNLRTQHLSEGDVPAIESALPSLPEDLSSSLLRTILGMYTDMEIDSRVRDNVKLVAKSIWDAAPVEARREAGIKQGTLAANGEVPRSNLAREFIEVVGGLDFLPDSTLAPEISMALDNLLTAHNGWNNFRVEGAPARLLHRLVPLTGRVPRPISEKYVKTLTMCTIGNGYGVSWAASEYYDDLISRFSDNDILAYVNLVHDQEIASRLQFPRCASRFKSLATRLSERVVRPRLKEILTFIEGCDANRLENIRSDAGFNQLRITLQT